MSDSSPALVLIVDDTETRGRCTRLLCRRRATRSSRRWTATTPIVVATEHRPDVVVSDMRMPGPVTTVDLCRHFTPLGVRVMVVTGVGPGEEHAAHKDRR